MTWTLNDKVELSYIYDAELGRPSYMGRLLPELAPGYLADIRDRRLPEGVHASILIRKHDIGVAQFEVTDECPLEAVLAKVMLVA